MIQKIIGILLNQVDFNGLGSEIYQHLDFVLQSGLAGLSTYPRVKSFIVGGVKLLNQVSHLLFPQYAHADSTIC